MALARLLAAAVLVSAGMATAGPPAVGADAASRPTETSNGFRCTVLGTHRADRLVGTEKRDVICGLGGDDVIVARGGDDVVDAGSGKDVVRAGAGDDTVLGGDDADRIAGGTGRDTVTDSMGRDLILGGPGADHLDGGYGHDRVLAGPGSDVLVGGSGADSLLGGPGNDDLVGDGGGDLLDGGSGTNWCSVDSRDVVRGCVADVAPPGIHELSLSAGKVDITDAARTVRIRVHLTDDTGVAKAELSVAGPSDLGRAAGDGVLALDGGTARNGWWATTVTVPRWAQGGEYTVQLSVRDRQHKTVRRGWESPSLQVVDREPDVAPPVVEELSEPLMSTVVDARGSRQALYVRMRLSDVGSGVGGVDVCLMQPTATGYSFPSCSVVGSWRGGSRYDGWWDAKVAVPRGAAGGVWNVAVVMADRARPEQRHVWMASEGYGYWVDTWAKPNLHMFPDGAGRFRVLGAGD